MFFHIFNSSITFWIDQSQKLLIFGSRILVWCSYHFLAYFVFKLVQPATDSFWLLTIQFGVGKTIWKLMFGLIRDVRYTMYLICFFDAFMKGFVSVHIDGSSSDGGHGSRFLAGDRPKNLVSLGFEHRIIYTGNFSLGSHIIEKNYFFLSSFSKP